MIKMEQANIRCSLLMGGQLVPAAEPKTWCSSEEILKGHKPRLTTTHVLKTQLARGAEDEKTWSWTCERFHLKEGESWCSTGRTGLLWLSSSISETAGINYAADANRTTRSLSARSRRCNKLVLRAPPRSEDPSAGFRGWLRSADRALTVHACVRSAEFLSSFHFLPSSATICAGSRTAEDMFFTLLIYGPDSRRKLPRLSPSQPHAGECRCS